MGEYFITGSLLRPPRHPANAWIGERIHSATIFQRSSDGHGRHSFGEPLEKYYRAVQWFANVIKNEERLQGRIHTY